VTQEDLWTYFRDLCRLCDSTTNVLRVKTFLKRVGFRFLFLPRTRLQHPPLWVLLSIHITVFRFQLNRFLPTRPPCCETIKDDSLRSMSTCSKEKQSQKKWPPPALRMGRAAVRDLRDSADRGEFSHPSLSRTITFSYVSLMADSVVLGSQKMWTKENSVNSSFSLHKSLTKWMSDKRFATNWAKFQQILSRRACA
jgi:hypothetical protein